MRVGLYPIEGVLYWIVETGGDGDCLFTSIAYLLRRYREEHIDDAGLRVEAALQLQQWLDYPPPQDFEEDVVFDEEYVTELGKGGDGEVCCVQALVESRNGVEISIHGLEDSRARVVVNYSGVAATDRLRILHYPGGGGHYRALVPAEEEVDDEEAIVDLSARKKEKAPRSIDVSLSTTRAVDENRLSTIDRCQTSLAIHHIDVGQGEATLFAFMARGQRFNVLVDGGTHDRGTAAVLACLTSQGLHVDLLVTSHFDADHFGGIRGLLEDGTRTRGANVLDRGGRSSKDAYVSYEQTIGQEVSDPRQELVEKVRGGPSGSMVDDDRPEASTAGPSDAKKPRVATKSIAPGQVDASLVGTALFDGGTEGFPIRMTCVAANGFVQTAKGPVQHLTSAYVDSSVASAAADERLENQMSLAFVIEFGTFVYFTGGDLETTQEDELGKWLRTKHKHVCGFKCSHHGSKHSTSEAFVGALDPTVAFISAGLHGKFKHPNQPVLDRLHGRSAYFTNCNYERNGLTPMTKVQDGPLRVAGGTNHSGNIVLRITDRDHPHTFEVGYYDDECCGWKLVRHRCNGKPEEALLAIDLKMPPASTLDLATSAECAMAMARFYVLEKERQQFLLHSRLWLTDDSPPPRIERSDETRKILTWKGEDLQAKAEEDEKEMEEEVQEQEEKQFKEDEEWSGE